MGTCASCRSFILFGGKTEGKQRYCSDKCLQQARVVAAAAEIPAAVVQQQVKAVHQGLCPKCGSTGPIDVHVGHRVGSAIVVTTWSRRPQISCRSCGIKHQLGDMVFSLVLGWWGFPWGILMTPVQIVKNIIAIAKPPAPEHPSMELEVLVRANLGAQMVANRGQQRVA